MLRIVRPGGKDQGSAKFAEEALPAVRRGLDRYGLRAGTRGDSAGLICGVRVSGGGPFRERGAGCGVEVVEVDVGRERRCGQGGEQRHERIHRTGISTAGPLAPLTRSVSFAIPDGVFSGMWMSTRYRLISFGQPTLVDVPAGSPFTFASIRATIATRGSAGNGVPGGTAGPVSPRSMALVMRSSPGLAGS